MSKNERIEPTLNTAPLNQPGAQPGHYQPPRQEPAPAPDAPQLEPTPEPAPAPAAAPTGNDALAKAQAEIAELKDRLLRTAAESENLRKRMEREKEDALKYGAAKFSKDILTVADNLRRAIENVPKAEAEASESVRNLVVGIEATERELLTVFERHGITRIDPKGQRFDPNQHQAMFEVQDPTQPSGVVVQVIAAGYMQHGRLLRAAMVGVSKGGPTPDIQPGQSINTQA
ncbi:nucleotide exchange factor GrpE [Ferrovibrio sp.]|uniref:nucleotide exchange factor GrpE n=1 Tax=Ferrovibrio sp. TaxID=1917215 RepID=UPI000CAC1FCD|nr:nucleotide exchange factor GrpE [Ferrovibrio sp.]PJI38970.1 MAG: nucleotide exchange factor GrpE [Ferrovibrio sp.]